MTTHNALRIIDPLITSIEEDSHQLCLEVLKKLFAGMSQAEKEEAVHKIEAESQKEIDSIFAEFNKTGPSKVALSPSLFIPIRG